MAIPFALMAAGTALQVAGQLRSNLDQAKSELQNAAFYKEQADFAWDASLREADLSRERYTQAGGAQVSAYARGGVDISGSAASVAAGTYANMANELGAIRRKGELDFKLAMARSRNAEQNAGNLKDFGYNLLQAGGTVLSNYAKSIDNGSAPSFSGGSAKTDSVPQSSGFAGGGSTSYLGNYNF